MSCVLRISGPAIKISLSKISLVPFRVEDEAAHFDVSAADFNDLNGQIEDAIKFLQSHNAE